MGSTCLSGSVDGVLSLGNLILPADGSPLLSFLSRRTCTRSSLRCTVSGTTLSDANVADRDRLILTTIASPTALGKALAALGSASATLERFEAAVAAGDAPHEEELTRLFELVDAAPLDGLSEAQRGECRRRRKAIVARLEALTGWLLCGRPCLGRSRE
ncbi:hypothetical protein EMIHUDRAFT_255951 [Emiliania huxleyi CCMP1516]|uniref:BAG domain-containing protein n=2 Tax=Emiliania huxleyi TaxID=2903 RepID=A0A0D3J179_EMIH1|nr:hypothetical protein EMIHUDRAFT_255951 [Emiliania huxleyi CCMP1516]EOD17264.1 hypothetical protein EMIHUDRAFT_255951 [Emiliania huxleyi CCMP1516]|eukprot:XP_005769693.1 hypothetical protein EMIHUDRAFT_255951 [Emiliania huxleyi CCMP1516]